MPRYSLRTLLIVLALGPMLLACVPGYFVMGTAIPGYKIPNSELDWVTPPKGEPGVRVFRIVRRYPHKWQRDLFRPFGALEARLRGIEVYIKPPAEDDMRDWDPLAPTVAKY